MKKRSLLSLLFVLAFTSTIMIPSAHAGNVQRHRWEGIAIGLGAVILGSVLSKSHQLSNAQSFDWHTPDYDNGPSRHYKRRHHHHRDDPLRGHWEMREEWLPPTYKRVWNPGHYSRHGKWLAGDWIKIEEAPGYWTKTRVWVARSGDWH